MGKKRHNLIKARKRKNFTQEQLGALINKQKTVISNWETGYATPALDDAMQIAQILEEDIYSLFSGVRVQETQT
ncbi:MULTISPECIES: helix-turn-helix transcriptional regulator [Bacillus cereus group]|uniref:Prophage LambdaBa02, DNA-binding protein n=1 Tax=Bacillus thuringiensis YBT-1518 TaxID=529122 RepID=A0A9W3KGN2_BACTU|nr:helix-turn-helix transcriptional regulator [Bacillus thuringiensis]EKS8362635.1 helix-turn-helix transcriptional regulator [Bacillus cereus]AHA73472.1 Prophage LambdaBa02, DNA-binding protein [Bacillus thuringiensis YBT-1518]EKS8370143.1 helix-turn-helix transcriptional regulator [Bacillus cereus]MBG9484586.1 DNA-binding protein [Bacillus thuringiensis]MBG9497165.1 DNA-binding protein [Bacillus thuringiensis]